MTQPEDMIERVARVLAGWTPNVTSWDDICDKCGDGERLRAIYRQRARTAIEAMQNPTDAVIDAGIDMLTERGCNPLSGDAEAIWQAMIDTALNQEEG